MKHVLSTRKLIEAFVEEMKLFVVFIRRAVPRTPIEEVSMAQFDNPYWEPLINWRGRLLGMERMLLAGGITYAELVKAKAGAGVPMAFREFGPLGDL